MVCIDISESGAPNLSFYDLPGIINQVEDRNKDYLPKLVKSLVKEYVQDNDTLVLLACSMESDVHLSSAGKLARDVKAEQRCIGKLFP